MSHRWDCPTDYEARRRGESDYESLGYRRYSTPYDDCPDARDAYLRGQRYAEYRAEEEAEQKRYEIAQQAAREQEYQEYQQYLDAMSEQEHEYFELLEMTKLAEEMAVIQ